VCAVVAGESVLVLGFSGLARGRVLWLPGRLYRCQVLQVRADAVGVGEWVPVLSFRRLVRVLWSLGSLCRCGVSGLARGQGLWLSGRLCRCQVCRLVWVCGCWVAGNRLLPISAWLQYVGWFTG